MKIKLINILVILIAFCLGIAGTVLFFYRDIFDDPCYIIPRDIVNLDEDEETESNIVEEEESFLYTYTAEAVEYEPNSTQYVGYKVCDTENSTCTIYGIDNTLISKSILSGQYKISFNSYGECNAATGTSYCIVNGEVEIVDLNN